MMAALKRYKMSLKKRNQSKRIVFVFFIYFQTCLFFYFTYKELQASTKVWKPERTQQSSSRRNNPINSLNVTVDMVNSYHPFIDFRLVIPEISPKVTNTSNIFIMVLVNSSAKGEKFRKHREVIRQTWGNRSNCEQCQLMSDQNIKHLRWLLVFVVGKAGQETDDDQLNLNEARQNNDMLIGNIEDNYINNIIKFYMGHIWASQFSIKYTLKVDDDVYVRIPGVLKYLVNAKFPKPFYGGARNRPTKVIRDINSKWAISWKYYEEKRYPAYISGAFFILSSDLLYRLFEFVYIKKPFHIDDAYVGIALRNFGVNATRIPSFRLRARVNETSYIRRLKDQFIKNSVAIGHNMTIESIRIFHKRLETILCGK